MLRPPDLHLAEQFTRQALAAQPGAAGLWNELGTILRQQGRDQEAVAAARQAVSLDPAAAVLWANLGNAHFQAQQWAEATAAYQQALGRDPNDVNVWNNLASAQIKSNAFTDAQKTLEHALTLDPAHPGVVPNYAYCLCRQSRQEDAALWLEQRLGMNPLVAEAWNKLGEVWQMMGEIELAISSYRRALSIDPQHPTAQYQLARMLRHQRRLTDAEAAARQLLASHPQHADAWALLGELLSVQGRTSEALAPVQHAVQIAPNHDRHARLLTVLQYSDDISPETLLAAHQAWDATYAQHFLPPTPPTTRTSSSRGSGVDCGNAIPLGKTQPQSTPDPFSAEQPTNVAPTGKPLRIGFVSADFGRHPIAFLGLPALEHLDRTACSIVCYSDRGNEDEYTARFRAVAHEWRSTAMLSDEFLAKQIAYDQIDVLVDLMGHTGKRLLVFARKPAPLQVTWLGYVGTTGLVAMDGLIADRFHVRAGEERYYAEQVLRMPHGYACYAPPVEAPPVQALPALTNSYITFGCFNNAAKYSPRLLEAWAAILLRVPQSRMLLKTSGIDDPTVAARLRQFFSERGVGSERILIEGWSPPGELLAHYHRLDIALDTLPYSGGLTTCEALWMGVPVITCPGRTFAGRHSTSHLTNAGCGEFVAADLAGYVELAVQWANQVSELAKLRSRLREQVGQSPLCDAPRFAADFLQLLQTASA